MGKFKVQIWSDVTCVHCFMAKRKFELALSQFEHAAQVEIVWRSFELASGLVVEPGISMYQFLANYNRATSEQAKAICDQIAGSARELDVTINFDTAVPANSFRAHKLAHLALHYKLQHQAKTALFKAHFTDGKNIDDIKVLVQLGREIGLDEILVVKALASDQYDDEIKQDILEARQRGIKGVPYYLFGAKHSVYGAKDSNTFLKTLELAYREWQLETGSNEFNAAHHIL